ncbi:MAG: NAD(P)H-hydrate dehydratase [Firmicutes bacterium]|nr:NAD(P)H-hydrate dehydratase [Bacillota bacterium]
MKKILTAQQTRELENRAASAGICHFDLMERAGNAAARYLLAKCGAAEKRTLILCGNGNNGGDGFVIARVLAQTGGKTDVLLVKGEPRTPDARTMYERAKNEKVGFYTDLSLSELKELCAAADLIVDAVYGIGFHGETDEAAARVLAAANASDAHRVAIDLPSGTECDSAQTASVCFVADDTLTFSTAKPVHWHMPAEGCCGRVTVLSLGIPEAVLCRQPVQAWIPDKSWAKQMLPRRPEDSNKGSFGKALCVCGSYGMAGAAMLAASAALRCGAGLVQLALPRSIYPCAASCLWEAVFLPLPESGTGRLTLQSVPPLQNALQQASSCLLGCGIGTDPETVQAVEMLLRQTKIPTVLDADGINCIAAHKDILKTVQAPLVLTPHPGEMARLTGMTTAQVQASRPTLAAEFAAEYGVVLVLKGHHTVIAAPDGRQWVNPTGNAGMARGGSGDLLAGMIAAFLAQGLSAEDAAVLGVWLHGAAGDICAQKHSRTAMQPHELLNELPELFLNLEKQD